MKVLKSICVLQMKSMMEWTWNSTTSKSVTTFSESMEKCWIVLLQLLRLVWMLRSHFFTRIQNVCEVIEKDSIKCKYILFLFNVEIVTNCKAWLAVAVIKIVRNHVCNKLVSLFVLIIKVYEFLIKAVNNFVIFSDQFLISSLVWGFEDISVQSFLKVLIRVSFLQNCWADVLWIWLHDKLIFDNFF